LRIGASGVLLLQTFSLAAKKPNVIYVFPDQLRNAAMGFWQDSVYRQHINWRPDPTYTPYLNRFASQSMVFSSAMSNCPVSSAHRGMLLTGLYPHQSGVSLNCNASRPLSDLRDDVTCISDIFHQAGYRCAYFGKLHVHFPTPNNPQAPGTYVNQDQPCWDAYTPPERRHGFEDWYSYGTFDEHNNPHYWGNNGEYFEPHAYSPIHEADTIIGYLRSHQYSNEPIFLMWGINPPHGPYGSLNDCNEQDWSHYKDIPLDSLLVRPNIPPELADKRKSAPYYFANVTGVDRAFGRVLAALDSLGMSDKTIVVFASDHGETMCSHVRDPKNSIYSESVNIPFIIRYPGHIQPNVSNELLSAIDIMPSLVSLAGLKKQLPDSLPGKDWSRYMTHPTRTTSLPHSVLYLRNIDGQKDSKGIVQTYFGDSRGVITKRYSFAIVLHRNGKIKETLLFDNELDPYQNNNLPLHSYPQLTKQLMEELALLLKEAKDPWWEDGTYERIYNELIND